MRRGLPLKGSKAVVKAKGRRYLYRRGSALRLSPVQTRPAREPPRFHPCICTLPHLNIRGWQRAPVQCGTGRLTAFQRIVGRGWSRICVRSIFAKTFARSHMAQRRTVGRIGDRY